MLTEGRINEDMLRAPTATSPKSPESKFRSTVSKIEQARKTGNYSSLSSMGIEDLLQKDCGKLK